VLTNRSYAIAGWVSALFVLIGLFDGFWKTVLLQGPHIGFWIYDLAKWIFLPTLLIAYLHRATNFSARDYGLSADLGLMDILYVVFLPLLSLFFVDHFAALVMNKVLGWPAPYFDHRVPLSALGPLWIVGTIYFSVTAGLWESIFLIGLPWLWFSRGIERDVWSQRSFALCSGFLFAAGHWENGLPNVVGVFLFQLLAIWWYFRLRTLWPVIGAHFLIDVYYFWPANA
jgi:membrane protease YdiL (CAAX protease family)